MIFRFRVVNLVKNFSNLTDIYSGSTFLAISVFERCSINEKKKEK